jgi:hypothetical protein
MNQKPESKGTPDVRQLRDNELHAIAGGTPGLAAMVSSVRGDAIGSAIDQLSQTSGLPR